MVSHWLVVLLTVVSLCLSLDTELEPTLSLMWTGDVVEYGNETAIPPLLVTALALNAQPQLTEEEFQDNELVQNLFRTYANYVSRARATPMMPPLATQCTVEPNLLSMATAYLGRLFALGSGSSSHTGTGPTLWLLAVVDDEVYEIGVKSWVCHGGCTVTPAVFSGSQWTASAFEHVKAFDKSLPSQFSVLIGGDESEWRATVRGLRITEGIELAKLNNIIWTILSRDRACP